MNASVAQATNVDANVQLLLAVVAFKALAPVRFFRNKVMKGQLNCALTTFTTARRSTHEGKRDGCSARLSLNRIATSGYEVRGNKRRNVYRRVKVDERFVRHAGSPSVLNKPSILGTLLCWPNFLRYV